MNALVEIIVNEVNKTFKTEKTFYEDYLHITQVSWNRWKRGERGFSDDKMKVIQSVLFTDYEWMLVNKIDRAFNYYPHNYEETTPVEIFHKAKLNTAKMWAELGAIIEVNSARNSDSSNDGIRMPGTQVKVKLYYDTDILYSDDTIRFYVKQSSAHIKAGRENRKKWFKANLKELI